MERMLYFHGEHYTQDDYEMLCDRADFFGMDALTEDEQVVINLWYTAKYIRLEELLDKFRMAHVNICDNKYPRFTFDKFVTSESVALEITCSGTLAGVINLAKRISDTIRVYAGLASSDFGIEKVTQTDNNTYMVYFTMITNKAIAAFVNLEKHLYMTREWYKFVGIVEKTLEYAIDAYPNRDVEIKKDIERPRPVEEPEILVPKKEEKERPSYGPEIIC